VEKKLVVFLIGFLVMIFISQNQLLAQFEDEFEIAEEEIVCKPESLMTIYDERDYGDVSLDIVRQWYSFGSEYYKNKNYKAAVPYLWKVFLNDTTKYARNAIRKLADSYFQLQQADSTLIACYRGLDQFPDHAVLHYFAGYLQDNLGKDKCAIPHYEALVADNPDREEYLEKLAFLYYKTDQLEDAIETQQKLVNLDPSNSKYSTDLALYMNALYGPGGGLEAFKQAWENDPENPQTAFKYGKAAYNAGEYKQAIKALLIVLEKEPNNGDAHEFLALSEEGLGQYNEAIAEYKKILETDPKNAVVMCNIASDYRNLNQFSNARYWVNRALQVKPGFGLAYMIMGEVYESAVTYCQNTENRKRKYDDGLVYQMALGEYQKAARDPNYRADANRRINSLKPYLPTDEETFMNQNRTTLKESCYTSWIN